MKAVNVKFRTAARRKALATQGMAAAIQARSGNGLDLLSPVCVYDFCERLDIAVRLLEVDMEGMYDQRPKPRIHVSALRPLHRRAFTCAHELGHHLFNHGSTIDQLIDDASERNDDNEVVADAFAAFFLMPTLGLRNAFVTRSLEPNTASPAQIQTIAANFGVGYETLIRQLALRVNLLTDERQRFLLKDSPKTIRAALLGQPVSEPLTLMDEHWTASTLDTEIGSLILLPHGCGLRGETLSLEQHLPAGALYRVTAVGLTQVENAARGWGTFIRSARKGYYGMARYRHLEETTDD